MKLSDLKTGMIVTTRDGREWCVFKDFECLHNETKCSNTIFVHSKNNSTAWTVARHYNGMKNSLLSYFDIVKVEIPCHPYSFLDFEYRKDERKLLWQEEPEIKEVTMSEVEEKFGCKVKIVGG